jgi:hypothetical protein
MMFLPKMNFVFDKKPSICAALSVSLKEIAPTSFSAFAVSILIALIDIFGLTHIELILRIQVIGTAAKAIASARDGSDPATRVHY